ncbi:hypothetical protein GCM10017786_03450 [Amycolatopsis deserti]|uniref:Uncharacterized protein n=1 Tax=Amycolatopsis deserti TaxID=185696 RepID=A0ABQ3IG05_9PSEU|nr:hypothetical protein [Amycolatopsis deserti]GHE77377.1 hypothetical protein GCM10017786_03450 [Amycolatopsis deserti]
MYATVHQFRRAMRGEREKWGTAGPGCLGGCVLVQVAGMAGVVVTFWPDQDSAAAARPECEQTWLDSRVYRVEFSLHAPGEPRFAQATWFDGPRREEVADAERRAGRDRIWPAVRDLPGLGTCYVLAGEDRASVVLGFADSVETIEAVQRAVMTTELLPGEDEALLPGPDRVDLHRVLYADLPAPVGDPR